MQSKPSRIFLASQLIAGLGIGTAHAHDPLDPKADADARQIDHIVVVGRSNNLIGEAGSASEGGLDREDMSRRPLLRPGDLVEYVPGVAATQHSGSGKANQYFLRGFNLDHGTDFAQFVDGMPINMRTHGHGHGYSDLNFIIPEMVDGLRYRKGPYFADVGDFSSAGTVSFRLADDLKEGFAQIEAGSFGYGRIVAGDSVGIADAILTWGAEAQTYDGSWKDVDEDVNKRNAMLRYSRQIGSGHGYLMALGYENRWRSPDQIPQRAVRSGLIDEFGSIDDTLRGESSRHSLSAGWYGDLLGGTLSASAYWIEYDLSLWSNFTYFLDDPVNGDQFRQFDERTVTGFDLRETWSGERWKFSTGLQGRRDDIGRVGLSRTRDLAFLSAIRDDRVDERSLGLWVQGEWQPVEPLRLSLGTRRDRYTFDVRALQPENSGRGSDAISSTKAGLAWKLGDQVELYANWGQGFHSNDVRGATISVDPSTGDPVDRVTPLVRTRGDELGMRWYRIDRWQMTLALWRLGIDSELIFVGDAGNTEASRPSDRSGVELGWTFFATPRSQIALEASYSRARFRDSDPAGRRIPGSVPLVLSAEWTADWTQGWHSSIRARHLGRYPLIEDGSVSAGRSTLLNAAIGRRWNDWSLELDILNLLDSRDHDIDYFYASRLPGEPIGGVEDVHYHIFEPRSFRVRLTRKF